MNFCKRRTAFCAGIVVLITVTVTVIWLISSFYYNTEDEMEHLYKLGEIDSHPEINIPVENENVINSLSSLPESEASHEIKADLRGIAYNGSNIYVAVGSMGKILTSADSINWMDRQSGIDKTLWGVTWGGKQFVAVGDEGTIMTSNDGICWILMVTGT